MSDLGSFSDFEPRPANSVDPSAADMRRLHRHVGFVPTGDIRNERGRRDSRHRTERVVGRRLSPVRVLCAWLCVGDLMAELIATGATNLPNELFRVDRFCWPLTEVRQVHQVRGWRFVRRYPTGLGMRPQAAIRPTAFKITALALGGLHQREQSSGGPSEAQSSLAQTSLGSRLP